MSPSPTPAATGEKRGRIAVRACDRCKAGKRKCDGLQPCLGCKNGRKNCTYVIIDKRRKPNTPPPPETSAPTAQPTFPPTLDSPRPNNAAAGPSSFPFASSTFEPAPFAPTTAPESDTQSPSAAQDDATLLLLARAMAHEQLSPAEDHPSGTDERCETGQQSFIERLHRHLKVTFALRSFPRGNGNGVDSEEADEGTLDPTTFFLPAREEAFSYIACYFEQAAATYRYLDRSDVEAWTAKFYDGADADSTSSDTVCLLLLVMAVGCLWMPSWSGGRGISPAAATPKAIKLYWAAKRRIDKLPMFPPRLSTVQSYLLMVQLQLGLTRYQSAWLTFGQAARLAQLLGLHRANVSSPDKKHEELRRRCFWCAFQMDRQISLVLGFPFLFHEADITQPYFTVPELDSVGANASNDSRTLIGSLASIKLSRIIGHAISQLHSPRQMPTLERDVCIMQLQQELDLWKLETPAFFLEPSSGLGGAQAFMQIPEFFLRQQRTLRTAFHFATLFIYRSYLLSSFLDHLPGTNRSTFSDPSAIPEEVRRCVEAAVAIAELATSIHPDQHGGHFWNTSYFTFASLTVLCVYTMLYENAPDKRRIEGCIDAAMRGHSVLAGSTSDEREQILKESRRMAGVLKERNPPQQPLSSVQPFDFLSFENTDVTSGTDGFGPGSAGWDAIWLDMQGLVQVGFDCTVSAGYDAETASLWPMPPLGGLS